MKTLVSIVIPCRNAARDLSGQLGVLANQAYDQPWEIIVSDNGSSDDTRRVAAEFADRLPLRVVDSRKRAGRAHACNVGVEAARGDVILFLDSDDEVAAGYIAAMAEELEAHDAVAARLDRDKLNPPYAALAAPGQQQGLIDVFGFLPFAVGCSLGVTRRAFDSVHGFAEDMPYVEDVDFCWRLLMTGRSLQFVPDALLYYRHRCTVRELFN